MIIALIAYVAILAAFRVGVGLVALPGWWSVKFTTNPFWTLAHNAALLYLLWTLYGLVK